MNKKNMRKALDWKIKDWLSSIDDINVRSAIRRSAIVTGGAFVSLLNSEEVNDYDVYFKDKESLLTVINYYVKEWGETHGNASIEILDSPERIMLRIKSVGAIEDDPSEDPREDILSTVEELEEDQQEEKPKKKYRPVFLSTNAITLSDKIQIVIRFFGSIEDIHKNYDYVHTTCSYDFFEREVTLPSEALECIINKELRYQGSRYPLASIIRSRKFMQRGWTINAGQYLKMALQLNELDLKDPEVLEDQLVGVDSLYFQKFISALKNKVSQDSEFSIDNTYLFELINRIF
jgi:hypothetical protein